MGSAQGNRRDPPVLRGTGRHRSRGERHPSVSQAPAREPQIDCPRCPLLKSYTKSRRAAVMGARSRSAWIRPGKSSRPRTTMTMTKRTTIRKENTRTTMSSAIRRRRPFPGGRRPASSVIEADRWCRCIFESLRKESLGDGPNHEQEHTNTEMVSTAHNRVDRELAGGWRSDVAADRQDALAAFACREYATIPATGGALAGDRQLPGSSACMGSLRTRGRTHECHGCALPDRRARRRQRSRPAGASRFRT